MDKAGAIHINSKIRGGYGDKSALFVATCLAFALVVLFPPLACAEPAMPPLCTARAQVLAKNEADSSFDVRVIDVRGIFSTLSCEGEVPEKGAVLKTSALVQEEFRAVDIGCVFSAGIKPSANGMGGPGSMTWENVVADCPKEKKLLRYRFSTTARERGMP